MENHGKCSLLPGAILYLVTRIIYQNSLFSAKYNGVTDGPYAQTEILVQFTSIFAVYLDVRLGNRRHTSSIYLLT